MLPILAIVPLLQSAANAIAAFTGTTHDASKSNAIADAAEIINAVAPLVDSFSRGIDVTEEDVRNALVGMDQALADFDAEIARQDTTGTAG